MKLLKLWHIALDLLVLCQIMKSIIAILKTLSFHLLAIKNNQDFPSDSLQLHVSKDELSGKPSPEHEQNKNDRITTYYLNPSLLIILVLTVSTLTVINYTSGFGISRFSVYIIIFIVATSSFIRKH